jgi:hypothetical protein
MRFQDVRLKGLGTGLLGAGLLGLLLGTCGTVKAQDARDEAKPQQEEPKQDEAKPGQSKEEPKAAKPGHEQEAPKAEEGKPAAKNDKNDKNEKQEDKRNSEMKPAQDQNRPMQNNDRAMQNNGGDHGKPAGAQGGQRIPDDKFRANFGRQHTFRVQTQVVQGQPRFQYGGYWFALANPWPGDWAYTDDCYVDYIDGEYVLIDLRHPGVEIALIVVEI